MSIRIEHGGTTEQALSSVELETIGAIALRCRDGNQLAGIW